MAFITHNWKLLVQTKQMSFTWIWAPIGFHRFDLINMAAPARTASSSQHSSSLLRWKLLSLSVIRLQVLLETIPSQLSSDAQEKIEILTRHLPWALRWIAHQACELSESSANVIISMMRSQFVVLGLRPCVSRTVWRLRATKKSCAGWFGSQSFFLLAIKCLLNICILQVDLFKISAICWTVETIASPNHWFKWTSTVH